MALAAKAKGVQVVADEAHQRVDITIDGKPFTSYVWPSRSRSRCCYPLITSDGIDVVRGFPLAPRPGERVDHPHHAGIWFNYGNVNGFDFWNNSDAIKPADRDKDGHHPSAKNRLHQKRARQRGTGRRIRMDDGRRPEHPASRRRATFSLGKTTRESSIRSPLCTLLITSSFNDDKEGLLGIRVARWLESANEKGGTFTDANGGQQKCRPRTLPGATGVYLTSEGKQGDQAWGTRGRWCALTGNTEGHTVTIAIFDHPGNPNYPTYWHARGYGLFAANPLGQHIFDPKAPTLELHHREESKRNLHVSHSLITARSTTRRNEPRRRRIRRRVPLTHEVLL